MTNKTITLTIERAKDGYLWGRVTIDDHLIVDSARSLDKLQRKFDKWLKVLFKIDPNTVEYELAYEVATIFDMLDYLNVSAVAKRAGINESLLRQYACGLKLPGKKATARIEQAIKDIAKELREVKLATP